MVKLPGHMNKLIHKLRAQQGFSMTELLVTLVLVGLITTAVAGGISMVARSYTRVVDRADAEQLLATTLNKMQDELGFARVDLETPKPDASGNWSFISGISGLRVRFALGTGADAAKGAYMQFVVDGTNNPAPYYFTENNNKRMVVKYDSCEPDIDDSGNFTGRFVITNLRVVSTKSGAPVLAKMENDKYYVAAINYRK
jgi:prepilin-type N-terminal cleavage/methylation domain-containing protein